MSENVLLVQGIQDSALCVTHCLWHLGSDGNCIQGLGRSPEKDIAPFPICSWSHLKQVTYWRHYKTLNSAYWPPLMIRLRTQISPKEGALRECWNIITTHPYPATCQNGWLATCFAVLGHNQWGANRYKSGVAMGTKCAPTFANIFMTSVEEEFLSQRWDRGAVEPSLWLRFIDDILVVWPGRGEGFANFLVELNSFHPNLEYTPEESTTDISFLDLKTRT